MVDNDATLIFLNIIWTNSFVNAPTTHCVRGESSKVKGQSKPVHRYPFTVHRKRLSRSELKAESSKLKAKLLTVVRSPFNDICLPFTVGIPPTVNSKLKQKVCARFFTQNRFDLKWVKAQRAERIGHGKKKEV